MLLIVVMVIYTIKAKWLSKPWIFLSPFPILETAKRVYLLPHQY